jgi:hypothetical protein
LKSTFFCDASEQAISAVAYLKVVDDSGATSLGFLVGKYEFVRGKIPG